LTKHYKAIILNGGLIHPQQQNIEESFMQMKQSLRDCPNIIYNVSGYDLTYAAENDGSTIANWIMNQPNVVLIDFVNQTNTIITNGGVTPKMNREVLKNNIETSFVSYVNGVPWHKKYYGGYGYIVSNNPLTSSDPQFYNYSLQMGNMFSDECKSFAQEISPTGLKETILL